MSQGVKSALVPAIVLSLILILSGQVESGRQRVNAAQNLQDVSFDWQTETWFGRKLAARILGNIPLWDRAGANRYLNLVGSGVALFAPAPGAVFSFAILDSDKVNAYAAPGGYIFVTRGAIARMRDEAELAAVLGHEIAHVACHHMAKTLGLNRHQESALGALAGLVGGATGSFRQAISQGLDKGLEILFETGYSSQQELEADRIGIQLAVMAGYRKDGLASFLNRIHGFEPCGLKQDNSHPVWKVRLMHLGQTMDNLGSEAGAGRTGKERFHEIFAHLFDADFVGPDGRRAE